MAYFAIKNIINCTSMNNSIFFSAITALIFPVICMAQFTLPEGNIASFPLEKLPGSARCVGMGGACTAISGNLDAALYNPANLNDLDELQFSVQLRHSELDALFLDQDALDSEFFGPAAGQLFKKFKETGTEPGYVGLGKSFGSWSLSAHYQKQLAFSGVFRDEEVWDVPNNQIFVNFNSLTTSIESFGVTASYAFSERWSAGVTLNNSELEVDSVDSWEIKNVGGGPVPSTGFDSVIVHNSIRDDDSQALVSIGVLYQPTSKFSFGLSWHQGGDFDLAAVPSTQHTLEGTTTGSTTSTNTTIGLPDILALGAAWRPSESLLFALNLDGISYSNLPPIRNRTLGYKSAVEGYTEAIKDTTSVRLGFEKIFITRRENAFLSDYTIRAGAYSEEDHDGLSTVEGYDTHFALGFAVTIGRSRRLKLDLGMEFGDEDKNYLVALTY